MDDIKDSIKDWIGARLSSPYFASVAAVWLFLNRVVIFGIFNFHENDTRSERIAWVQQELSNQHFFILHGVDAGIVKAFVLGLLVMIAYELIATITIAIYSILTKFTNKVKAHFHERDWYSKAQVHKLMEEYQQKIDDLDKGYKTLLNISNETSRTAAIAADEKKIAVDKLALFEKQKTDSDTRLIDKSKADEKLISQLTSQIAELQRTITKKTNVIVPFEEYLSPIDVVEYNSAAYAVRNGIEVPTPLLKLLLDKALVYKNGGQIQLTQIGVRYYEYTKRLKENGELIVEKDL